ncbi:hypothetical protein LGQ02_06545 [Bacillus shivajii]|uniref:hypothetical protein n=1 Tax=Bacillus shivajii TaxID=1983719 RepID=UPI001CFB2A3F|nr:hypothetical protein [Bacillus shivajii]UCZ54417.1 hypothetical protein LGQ02_06545 [Bacillus shivajii]
MKRFDEQKTLRRQLNEELSSYEFSRKDEVMKRTHPKSFGEQFNNWWNKEVTIPLLPVGMAVILLFSVGTGSMFIVDNKDDAKRIMVEKGGNLFWSDLVRDEGMDE